MGPCSDRNLMEAVRLSALVAVVITAPGLSRMAGMTKWRPFPARGGPSTKIESSTEAQHSTLRDDPSE
jgi:hypothetical protein